MKEVYKCGKCKLYKGRDFFHERRNSSRPVAAACKECRMKRQRDVEYFKLALKKYGRLCPQCQIPKPLIPEVNMCKKCLHKHGLNMCTMCKQVLLKDIFFPNKKSVCFECRNKYQFGSSYAHRKLASKFKEFLEDNKII